MGDAPGLSQETQLSPQNLKEPSTSEVTAGPRHFWPRTDHGQERGNQGYRHRRPADSESGLAQGRHLLLIVLALLEGPAVRLAPHVSA